MYENSTMVLDYHLKRARPENYLDTLVNLMCSDYVKNNYYVIDTDELIVDGVFLHPIDMWDISLNGLATFLSDLNEDELYKIFLNFYAYYRNTTSVTPAAIGLIILSAVFVGVSFRLPRFTTALQHVEISIVSGLFNQIADLEECLQDLVYWYFEALDTSEIYDIIIHNKTHSTEAMMEVVIDDLTLLCCDLFIALGNYMGALFGLGGFYKGLENILEEILLTSYDNMVSRYDMENSPVYKDLEGFIKASFSGIERVNENIPNFRRKVFTYMRNKGYVIENNVIVYREYMLQDNTYFDRIMRGEF